jgi:hypothetical protein
LPWRFSIEGETLELDVKGSLIANDADLLVHVALNGTGVVYVLRDFADADISPRFADNRDL